MSLRKKGGRVQRLDKSVADAINAQQVITEPVSVIKELVENALDAGAMSVEVSFSGNAFSHLRVVDNGSGVKKEDYEKVCRRGATSKLSSFNALASSTSLSLGFRGEALAALCAVCQKVRLHTCTDESDVTKGVMLHYGSTGELQQQVAQSRQKGTSVMADGLFHNLRVRRIDAEKQRRKHISRMVALLQRYALLKTHVKFSLRQDASSDKGDAAASAKTLLQTRGSGDLVRTLRDLFDARLVRGMKTFNEQRRLQLAKASRKLRCRDIHGNDSDSEDDDNGAVGFDLGSFVFDDDKEVKKENEEFADVRVHGAITHPSESEGRGSAERQFMFVNRRPVHCRSLRKRVNTLFAAQSSNKRACFALFVETPAHLVDSNVTPDKTVVLFDQRIEAPLMQMVEEVLEQVFRASQRSFGVRTTQTLLAETKSVLGKRPLSAMSKSDQSDTSSTTSFVQIDHCCHHGEQHATLGQSQETQQSEPSLGDLKQEVCTQLCSEDIDIDTMIDMEQQQQERQKQLQQAADHLAVPVKQENDGDEDDFDDLMQLFDVPSDKENKPLVPMEPVTVPEASNAATNDRGSSASDDNINVKLEPMRDDDKDLSEQSSSPVACRSVSFDTSTLAAALDAAELKEEESDGTLGTRLAKMTARGEDEYKSSTLRKEDLSVMAQHVAGQFNLGFIVARFNSQLFVVDQHASDEIRNFERLLGELQVHTQPLVAPLPAGLPADLEDVPVPSCA
ncbi:MAG: hypothetical protein MHM6MM_000126 [Cercozoa sp. M6MM]